MANPDARNLWAYRYGRRNLYGIPENSDSDVESDQQEIRREGKTKIVMIEPLIIIAAGVFLLASTVAYACWSVVRVQLLRQDLLELRARTRQLFDDLNVKNTYVFFFEAEISDLIDRIENESSFSLIQEELNRRRFFKVTNMYLVSDHVLASKVIVPMLERIRMRVMTYCFLETLSGMLFGGLAISVFGWRAFRRRIASPGFGVAESSVRAHRRPAH